MYFLREKLLFGNRLTAIVFLVEMPKLVIAISVSMPNQKEVVEFDSTTSF
jgi:hypothetical protein